MELKDICGYSSERIQTSILSEDNYISTENMLPNKGGIVASSNVPNGSAVAFLKGDILISNIRPYFQKIWQADRSGGCSADVLCIRAKESANPEYLYYLLSQPDFFDYVMSGAKGCKMPRGDKKQIMSWPVDLPDYETQVAIGKTLKSLDAKIELNRRINDNLEQQAQALYKSWFVDFEPFKDGKFVDSELGLIPEGWQTGTLDELVYIDNTSINPALKPTTLFSHYSIPAFDNMMCPETQFGNEILSNKFVVSPESILLSKLNPRIKRIWCVLNAHEDSVCSTEFVQLKTINPTQTAFAYGLITSEFFYQYVLSFVNGATGSHQRFHPQDILSFPLAYSNDAVSRFSELLSPVLKEQDIRRTETQNLCKLRDSLLPKLMSGELKIDQLDA